MFRFVKGFLLKREKNPLDEPGFVGPNMALKKPEKGPVPDQTLDLYNNLTLLGLTSVIEWLKAQSGPMKHIRATDPVINDILLTGNYIEKIIEDCEFDKYGEIITTTEMDNLRLLVVRAKEIKKIGTFLAEIAKEEPIPPGTFYKQLVVENIYENFYRQAPIGINVMSHLDMK